MTRRDSGRAAEKLQILFFCCCCHYRRVASLCRRPVARRDSDTSLWLWGLRPESPSACDSACLRRTPPHDSLAPRPVPRGMPAPIVSAQSGRHTPYCVSSRPWTVAYRGTWVGQRKAFFPRYVGLVSPFVRHVIKRWLFPVWCLIPTGMMNPTSCPTCTV